MPITGFDTAGKPDPRFIRAAVEASDLNALRIALLQATGDPELAAMRVESVARTSGLATVQLADEHRQPVIEKAVDFLVEHAKHYKPILPTDNELRRLMELTLGHEVTESDFVLRAPALAFESIPFAAKWSGDLPVVPEGFHIAIVGAGFSGIGMGVQLEQLGIPYTIFERRSEVGGTWSINRYPEARVDVVSFLYSYAFEQNYPWTEIYARQPEVRGYLEYVSRKFGVHDHIRFDHDVPKATFDPSSCTWSLEIARSDGSRSFINANIVISAVGLFAQPRAFNVAGMDRYRGEIVHTTEWVHGFSATDKSVAIVGNGSSGVQVLAPIASEASQVYVCQRTPQWITPRPGYGEPVSSGQRWLLDSMPYYWNWSRFTAMIPGFMSHDLLVIDRQWQARGGGFNETNDKIRAALMDYIHSKIGDRPDLVAKVIPNYPPWGRRMVTDNRWYETLRRDHVELVTEPISELTTDGIVTVDGVERQVDMIIAAVGFDVAKYLSSTEYNGPGDVTLDEVWRDDGPRAYMGMLVAGFPNLFILYGPNAQPVSGGLGLPMTAEMWTRYVAKVIIAMLEHGNRAVEVAKEPFLDYNLRVDKESEDLIWVADPSSRTQSYYVNDKGRMLTNAPWRPTVNWRYLAEPELSHFVFT